MVRSSFSYRSYWLKELDTTRYKTRSGTKSVTPSANLYNARRSPEPSLTFVKKKQTNKQTTNYKLLGSIDTEQPVDNSANYTEIESKIYELASWQVATETPNKLGFVNIPSAETYEIIS